MMYLNSKYKQFKTIINVKSASFEAYKRSSQAKLAKLQLVICLDVLSIIELGANTTLSAVWRTAFLIAATIGVGWKWQKGNFFASFPDKYDDMLNKALSLTDEEKIKLLKKARDQLEKNKLAVKTTGKIVKWIFIVVVIGTVEDDIKSWFNVNDFQGDLVFLFVFLTIALTLFFAATLIGTIMDILLDIKDRIDIFINDSVEYGMFVKNYELLEATIYVLSDAEDKKKGERIQLKK